METLRDPCPICRSTSIVVPREYQKSTSVPEMWQPVGELERKVVSRTKAGGPGEEILTLILRPSGRGPNFAGQDATAPLVATMAQLAGGRVAYFFDRCELSFCGTISDPP